MVVTELGHEPQAPCSFKRTIFQSISCNKFHPEHSRISSISLRSYHIEFIAFNISNSRVHSIHETGQDRSMDYETLGDGQIMEYEVKDGKYEEESGVCGGLVTEESPDLPPDVESPTVLNHYSWEGRGVRRQ
ncbi:hypothetical protein L1887_17438 [Cichorium endivia]|nr:hypothetical protein L1887_17438 [Cichorium endivia]